MNRKISPLQAITLLSNTIVPTAILVIPSLSITFAYQDAWLPSLIATILGVAFALLVGSVARQNPGVPFPVWMEQRFGRLIGMVIGLLLIQYYISMSAMILQEICLFFRNQVLKETPIEILMLCFMLVTCYAVSQGIEVIARICLAVTFISLFFYSVSFMLMTHLFDFNHLLPFLDQSPGPLVYAGLPPLSWISEAAVILILVPFLNQPKKASRITIWGVLLSGIHLTITVVLAIIVLGPRLPEMYQYPSFTLIEVIRMGSFIQRIDLLFIAFWICTTYVKMSVFLFGAYHCFTETFHLRRANPLLWVISLLILLTALLSHPDEAIFNQQNQYVTPLHLITINIVLPLFIWIGLKAKLGKKGDDRLEKKSPPHAGDDDRNRNPLDDGVLGSDRA